MKRPKNRNKRENRYTICILHTNENGREAWAKWRNVLVDNVSSWERTKKAIRAWYPGVIHVNIYGGVTRKFYKQVKAIDL